MHQVVARGSQETKVLPNNTNNELQPRSQLSQTNDTFLKHTSKPEEDDQETEQDTSSDSDFPPLHRCPNPIISCSDADPDPIRFERPHTPPPWDTSLTGYGSVLEVSRPFRARRVFEHPLVEGHFWGNKGDDSGHYGVGGDLGGGGGPIVTEARRKMWRRLESGKGKGKGNVVNNKDKMKEQHRKIKSKGVEKSQKTINRMSEWRRWKPLPKYPACTGVAQRASTCAAAAAGDKAWIEEVVEEAEDQEYQGGDEKEEEDEEKDEDEEGEDDEDAEDLEEAIKRFLEIKIPVDLNSLRRLRTSFAGTGEHTTTTGSGTGEAAGGEAGEEDLEKAMEGEEGQLSPLVESLMFTDTDIEGFEFLFEEEDEGGGIWDSRIVVGVESGRVDGKGEVCKMNGPTGGFAGGDASRAEVSEEDTGHKVRRAFSATQRLSRWKEKK